MPPLYYLHTWWARRPLAASRFAATLSALPIEAYSKDTIQRLLTALGLRGDPIKAVREGKRSFSYPVFEGVNPNPRAYINKAEKLWGRKPVGADFMAGGGSIPFEMARVGYGAVIAGEYNPIAYTILKASLEYPIIYKDRLVRDVERYGRQLLARLRQRVKEYYPPHPSGQPNGYIWTRIFNCPLCGCEIPSLGSLWLDREKGFAYYPILNSERTDLKIVPVEELERRRVGGKIESTVRIVDGEHAGIEFETRGYVSRGILECPAYRHTLDRDEPKRQNREYLEQREAQGYYGSQSARLTAVTLEGKVYIEPTEEMKQAYKKAEEYLKDNWEAFTDENLIPLENVPYGQETARLFPFGIDAFYKLFNARQLLVHAEIVQLIRELRGRVIEDEVRRGRPRADAEEYSKVITTYLTIAFGKTFKYNTTLSSWNYSSGFIRSAFSRHAFAWTWDYSEIGVIPSSASPEWAIQNMLKSLKGLVKRLYPIESPIQVVYGDAAKAEHTKKIDVIITDPPYYGNVQYSELSDYFYVWFKETLTDVYPEAYGESETPKQDEAVANRVRHGSDRLADEFYEEKMREIFRNHHGILDDNGILVLWFAHKSGAAWSSTIQALLDSGFTITSLWGINAERAYSFHISGKAALHTNILLTCRKREGGGGYIQDAVIEMERELGKRLNELEKYGVVGPDFLMAAQAEALKSASTMWPLRDPQGRMEPGEILDYMMDQAIGHAVNYLTRKVAPQIVGVDAPTKFYVLTRHLYQDIVSYDDARRIALACLGATGVGDPVQEVAVATGLGKMSTTSVGGESTKVLSLLEPWERARRGTLNEGRETSVVDYVHRAIAVLEEGGSINTAAEALASAGASACQVIKGLYEVLPERIQRRRSSVVNRERQHLQTLLLGVCQEGLHLLARRKREERDKQTRLDRYGDPR